MLCYINFIQVYLIDKSFASKLSRSPDKCSAISKSDSFLIATATATATATAIAMQLISPTSKVFFVHSVAIVSRKDHLINPFSALIINKTCTQRCHLFAVADSDRHPTEMPSLRIPSYVLIGVWNRRTVIYLQRHYSSSKVYFQVCWLADLLPTWGAVVLTLIAYIFTGGHYTMYLAWNSFPRDVRGAYR